MEGSSFIVTCDCGEKISVPYWGRGIVCPSCMKSIPRVVVVKAEIHHKCCLLAEKGVQK